MGEDREAMMSTKRKSLRHREHMARMKHRVEGGVLRMLLTKGQAGAAAMVTGGGEFIVRQGVDEVEQVVRYSTLPTNEDP